MRVSLPYDLLRFSPHIAASVLAVMDRTPPYLCVCGGALHMRADSGVWRQNHILLRCSKEFWRLVTWFACWLWMYAVQRVWRPLFGVLAIFLAIWLGQRAGAFGMCGKVGFNRLLTANSGGAGLVELRERLLGFGPVWRVGSVEVFLASLHAGCTRARDLCCGLSCFLYLIGVSWDALAWVRVRGSPTAFGRRVRVRVRGRRGWCCSRLRGSALFLFFELPSKSNLLSVTCGRAPASGLGGGREVEAVCGAASCVRLAARRDPCPRWFTNLGVVVMMVCSARVCAGPAVVVWMVWGERGTLVVIIRLFVRYFGVFGIGDGFTARWHFARAAAGSARLCLVYAVVVCCFGWGLHGVASLTRGGVGSARVRVWFAGSACSLARARAVMGLFQLCDDVEDSSCLLALTGLAGLLLVCMLSVACSAGGLGFGARVRSSALVSFGYWRRLYGCWLFGRAVVRASALISTNVDDRDPRACGCRGWSDMTALAPFRGGSGVRSCVVWLVVQSACLTGACPCDSTRIGVDRALLSPAVDSKDSRWWQVGLSLAKGLPVGLSAAGVATSLETAALLASLQLAGCVHCANRMRCCAALAVRHLCALWCSLLCRLRATCPRVELILQARWRLDDWYTSPVGVRWY